MRLVTTLTLGFRSPLCPCQTLYCSHGRLSGALGCCNQGMQRYNITYSSRKKG